MEAGVPGGCSYARGWRWTAGPGKPEWRAGVSGASPAHADLAHVLCGNCEGVDEEARRVGRGELRGAMQRCRKVVTRAGRRGTPAAITEGRADLVSLIDAAQRALAKGARATAAEREAFRQWLAGDLPHVDGGDRGNIKGRAREVADAIRGAQRAAAGLRDAWAVASRPEMARRREREGYTTGREWKAVAIETWGEGAGRARTPRWAASTPARGGL